MMQRSQFRQARNYYLALGSEILRPALRGYARLLSGRAPTPPSRWRRGILLGAAHIGDLLYRSASLGPLREGLPECEWYYLAEAGPAEVLRTHPALAGVIEGTVPRPGSADFFRLARVLRHRRFDVAISYGTGNYWPELLLATHAAIPNRVGYTHKGFSGLVTHPIQMRGSQPYSAHFRDLVADLTGRPPEWSLRPLVVACEADEQVATEVWEALKLAPNLPAVACFVTTRQPFGQWPQQFYGETLARLREEYRVQLLLCGATSDRDTLELLKSKQGWDYPVIAGRLPLRALVAFLRRVVGVFSTDSGPRHLANAAGVPVCFMRNLWSPKLETGVYLETELDLAPDAELVAPGSEAEAFSGVSPQAVARRIAAHLGLSPVAERG